MDLPLLPVSVCANNGPARNRLLAGLEQARVRGAKTEVGGSELEDFSKDACGLVGRLVGPLCEGRWGRREKMVVERASK